MCRSTRRTHATASIHVRKERPEKSLTLSSLQQHTTRIDETRKTISIGRNRFKPPRITAPDTRSEIFTFFHPHRAHAIRVCIYVDRLRLYRSPLLFLRYSRPWRPRSFDHTHDTHTTHCSLLSIDTAHTSTHTNRDNHRRSFC